MPQAQYPLINGVTYDYSSVEFNILGVLFNGVKSINYSHKLTPGEKRGNSPQVVGRTRGKYEASGNMELYRGEYDKLVALLATQGRGILEAIIPVITVTMSENLVDVSQDALGAVRIMGNDFSGQEGGEALVVKCDLSILQLLPNGQLPFNPTLFRRVI